MQRISSGNRSKQFVAVFLAALMMPAAAPYVEAALGPGFKGKSQAEVAKMIVEAILSGTCNAADFARFTYPTFLAMLNFSPREAKKYLKLNIFLAELVRGLPVGVAAYSAAAMMEGFVKDSPAINFWWFRAYIQIPSGLMYALAVRSAWPKVVLPLIYDMTYGTAVTLYGKKEYLTERELRKLHAKVFFRLKENVDEFLSGPHDNFNNFPFSGGLPDLFDLPRAKRPHMVQTILQPLMASIVMAFFVDGSLGMFRNTWKYDQPWRALTASATVTTLGLLFSKTASEGLASFFGDLIVYGLKSLLRNRFKIGVALACVTLAYFTTPLALQKAREAFKDSSFLSLIVLFTTFDILFVNSQSATLGLSAAYDARARRNPQHSHCGRVLWSDKAAELLSQISLGDSLFEGPLHYSVDGSGDSSIEFFKKIGACSLTNLSLSGPMQKLIKDLGGGNADVEGLLEIDKRFSRKKVWQHFGVSLLLFGVPVGLRYAMNFFEIDEQTNFYLKAFEKQSLVGLGGAFFATASLVSAERKFRKSEKSDSASIPLFVERGSSSVSPFESQSSVSGFARMATAVVKSAAPFLVGTISEIFLGWVFENVYAQRREEAQRLGEVGGAVAAGLTTYALYRGV